MPRQRNTNKRQKEVKIKAKLTLAGVDPRPVHEVAALSVRLDVEVELHHEDSPVGAQVGVPDGGRRGRDGDALHGEVDFSARGGAGRACMNICFY